MKSITVEQFDEGIYQLQLNRPEKYNAFNPDMIDEITVTLNSLKTDSNLRLLLIAGNGKNFSAGADLDWMRNSINYSATENFADAEKLATMLKILNEFPVPTIALVHGKTFGGGIGLIACCDFAIAEINANFCFSETRIGLIPAIVSPYIISAVGNRIAKQLFLSAQVFSAQQAYEYGLISNLAVEQPLFDAGIELAKLLLNNSPQALRMTKQLFHQLAHTQDTHSATHLTCNFISKIRISKEGQEGLTAFLEKRRPNWQKHKDIS